MPDLLLRSHDFTHATVPNGNIPLSFAELVHASLTVGRAPWDAVFRDPDSFVQDLLWRFATMNLALEPGPGAGGAWFVHTRAFQMLESTEKVGLSYLLGMAVTKALAERYLRIPFLMHVSTYAREPSNPLHLRSVWKERFEVFFNGLGLTPRPRTCVQRFEAVPPMHRTAMLQTVFPPPIYSAASAANLDSLLRVACSMSAPDLFGFELDNAGLITRWTVIECKGRSRRLPGGAGASPDFSATLATQAGWPKESRNAGYAMQQAVARTHVGTIPVGRHVASYVHFSQPPGVSPNHRRVLNTTWKDPASGPDEVDPKLQEDMVAKFLRDYYAPIFALVRGARSSDLKTRSQSHLQSRHFRLSIHPSVVKAFDQDEPAGWIGLPRRLSAIRPSNDEPDRLASGSIFNGPDGVRVTLLGR